MLEGAAVSALAHGLLIGGWLFLHRDIERVSARARRRVHAGRVPHPEGSHRGHASTARDGHVDDARRGSRRGLAQDEKKEAPRDEPRMEMVVPDGKAADTDAAPKALEEQPPIQLGDSIMTELQVDSAVVRYENSAAPAYPESMLQPANRRIGDRAIRRGHARPCGHADVSRDLQRRTPTLREP